MPGDVRLTGPLERALHLKTVPVLSGLAPRELATLARYTRERYHVPGETILVPGAPVDRLLVIISGTVRATGGEHRDEELGPGRAIGYLSLLSGDSSDLEAKAVTGATVLEVEREALEDLFEDDVHILYGQAQILARRLLAVRKRIPDGTELAPDGWDPIPDALGADLIARLRYMRQGGAFRNASLDALVELARRLEEVSFAPGETIWRTGTASGYAVILTAGRVRCTLPDGRHFIAGPGYPMGNLESQCGELRWYDATAETPTHGLRAETQFFLDIMEDHVQMARDYLSSFARNVIRVIQEGGEEAP